MKKASSFETLTNVYQTTQLQTPEDGNIYSRRYHNLKSRKELISSFVSLGPVYCIVTSTLFSNILYLVMLSRLYSQNIFSIFIAIIALHSVHPVICIVVKTLLSNKVRPFVRTTHEVSHPYTMTDKITYILLIQCLGF
jgi:hypothetical protein